MHPYTDNPEQQVQSIGESVLLAHILEWLGKSVLPLPHGPGDDCALLPSSGKNRMITTDPVWFIRHFDENLSPEAVGRKLVARNLSDLAAAGATPEGALFSLFAPGNLNLEWLERCCRSIGETSLQFNLGIAGGDLAETPSDFGMNLTVWGTTGDPVPGRAHVSDSDTLWVTGKLGGSLLGPHWQFTPRLQEGKWLAQSGQITSMMDLSDGLAADLPRLLGETHGAVLNLKDLPLRPEAKEMARSSGQPDWLHGWSDGEDYELLFALHHNVSPEAFQQQWNQSFPRPVYCIGTVKTRDPREPQLHFTGDCIPPADTGYEHFKRKPS